MSFRVDAILSRRGRLRTRAVMDYCLRFYERQFITRKALNVSTLERFSELLSEYLLRGEAAANGVPTVRYFAQRIHLSPNYLGDLVKTETGYSAQEFIAQRLVPIQQARTPAYPDCSLPSVSCRTSN